MNADAHEWGPGELVGEHRLLRRLGRGERAEVWLAAPALVEDGARVALKLVRPGGDAVAPLREAETLWRARGRHVVELREVVPAAGRPALVLEHVPHALEELAGGGMSPGAVVTVLAPIAAELRRLHDVGILHGAVRLAAVRLRADGEPVLLGFGGSRIARGSALEAGALADARDFRATALTLASLATAPTGPGWIVFRDWLAAAEPASPAWLDEFPRRAFEAAEPAPVALPGAADFAAAFDPPSAPEPSGAFVLDDHGTGRATPRATARLRRLVPANPLRGMGAVRRRVWVPLVLVGAGLVALAVALPPSGAPPASASGPTATESPSPSVSEPREAPPAPEEPGSASSAPPGASSSADPGTTATAAERAAVALLATRARCYEELSEDCLAGLVESGSDADAEDRAAIRALGDGEGSLPLEFAAVAAREYQRLGDAAIVDAVDASGAVERLLLMLTPEGWRIRAYL